MFKYINRTEAMLRALTFLLLMVISTMIVGQSRGDVEMVLRKITLNEADQSLAMDPITITSAFASRSAGGRHDFFSEGDYWWPDPQHPDGAYIQRDGMTNPENFVAHRKVMIRFSRIVGALVSAYQITGDKNYASAAVKHLQAWFIRSETRMNPNLNFAQAIKGRATGRGIGIIDTIHLMEVAQATLILIEHHLIDDQSEKDIRKWFEEYIVWLRNSPNGIEEMNAKNNHGTCWVMQTASFAKLVNDTATIRFCRDRYKHILLPQQMDGDGSFPLELRRTKPYGYSIFNLDAMVMTCHMLSDNKNDLWRFKTNQGTSIYDALGFLYPYLKDKTKWPGAKDVMYWDHWPVAQPALLFGAVAFQEEGWFTLWKSMDHEPNVEEVIRNLPIRHPLLWLEDGKR